MTKFLTTASVASFNLTRDADYDHPNWDDLGLQGYVFRKSSMFTAEEFRKMTEPESVVAIIKAIGCNYLGDWFGCCCSNFSIRGVDVDIACGKGRDQGIWIYSHTDNYANEEHQHGDPALLRPIMDEVIRQLEEKSGRGGKFAEHFHPWTREE